MYQPVRSTDSFAFQGEVESIAQMKPKAPNEHEDGLLEYLEDIIGTSKYKEPIEETLVKVDQLNEERSEKMNRLRLIEKDKASLEEKKKEVETWLRNKVGQIHPSPERPFQSIATPSNRTS